ncbi:MAG: hypothetical protein A2156_12460 [Deltaproteobacteria bacterium RBG_16_48_10]|nr:MAG: hypothetical protein A2156_12460 [Deltaproteobacteria bacterium RBG_16_48_10]
MEKIRGLTRRTFLTWLLGGPLLSFLPLSEPEAMANLSPPGGEGRGGSIAEFFGGEELVYEIGFWLFNRAALGRLSFKGTEKQGQYVAILETETLGILGFVSRYRVDMYRSTMEEIEGGSRLRSLLFEEEVRIGNRLTRRVTRFDYPRRKWITVKWRKDGTLQKTEEEIPYGKVYDDFLTSSYNFRYGAYGGIERGKTYRVPTFPRKGATSYEIRVAAKEEEERKRRPEKRKDQKEFFVKLLLDSEITHSKEGRIEGWLSKELLPVEGTLKDAFLFGDVKGTLIRNNRTSSSFGARSQRPVS